MRPTIAEERAMALGQPTRWRRNGPYAAAAFFVLTALAVAALAFLFGEGDGPVWLAGVLAIVVAEVLIWQKFYGTGVESALWIGGTLSIVFSLPESGAREALLVIALAFAIPAWRMQNALFGAIACGFAVAYGEPAWTLALAVAVVAVAAKARVWRRPWIDLFFALVAIGMPLLAFEEHGSAWRALCLLAVAAVDAIAGLKLREHLLLVASGVAVALAAYEAHELLPLALEHQLLLGGALLLACAGVLSHALRGRTRGLVATRAQLTEYDELLKLGATMVAAPAGHPQEAAAEPGYGGAGSFGGAGASGDF
jgi:hypothetical protein